MSEYSKNEPAFPSHGTMGEVNHQGMTLRDYFAGKAMEGILSKNYFPIVKDGKMAIDKISEDAYLIADAMLKERSRERE